jgi:prophage tail gpP-like protein
LCPVSDAQFLELLVNGVRYRGWKRASITRTIDAVAGSFSLTVTDAWSDQPVPWPIREGDACSLIVGGTPLVTGYVDKRSATLSATSHSVSIEGRDAAATLADCSADVGWQFKSQPFLPFIQLLCAPYGIPVEVDELVPLPYTPADLSITPGDSVFSVIDRLCKFAGILPVSDGAGGLRLMQPGVVPSATVIVEGFNLLEGSAEFDAGSRYAEIVVMGQATGGAKPMRASVRDLEVKRQNRKLIIQAESATTPGGAQARAEYERAIRAARAESVSVTVAGLYAVPGWHWRPGETVQVQAPRLGVDGVMVIQEIQQEVEMSTRTTLRLVRPDAYAADPQEVGQWKK